MSLRSSINRRQRSRSRRLDSTSAKLGQRRLGFESLEDRRLLASLDMAFVVRATEPGGEPGAETNEPIDVGSDFWVELQVKDSRAPGAPGVIALPLTVQWDNALVQYVGAAPIVGPNPASFNVPLNNPLLTPDFPLQRFVDSDGSVGSFTNLRGGALPNANLGAAIGTDGFELFSQMKFRATAEGQVCFDAGLAGSMSFADAAPLDNDPAANRCVTIFRDGPEPERTSSLSGFVYLDSNRNGKRDVDQNGIPLELGLPNVTIHLYRDGQATPVQTVDTGPGGWYHFENLAPGVYTIEQVQPELFLDGEDSLGIVLPGGQPRGQKGNDVFSNIALNEGEHGIDYNFGEGGTTLVNKRMFLASKPHVQESIGNRQGVPTKVIEGTPQDDTIESKIEGEAFQITVNGTSQTIPFTEARIVAIDARQGNNTVTVIGTSAPDTAYSAPGYATLRRDDVPIVQGYGMEVTGAKTVVIDAGGDGQNDRIVMQDSPQNDVFVAGDTAPTNPPPLVPTRTASLTADDTGMRVLARRFQQVRAVSSAGGTDQAIQQAHDMALTLVGNWQP